MGDMVKILHYFIHLFASTSKLDVLVRLSLHGGGEVSLTFISSATSRDSENTTWHYSSNGKSKEGDYIIDMQ